MSGGIVQKSKAWWREEGEREAILDRAIGKGCPGCEAGAETEWSKGVSLT